MSRDVFKILTCRCLVAPAHAGISEAKKEQALTLQRAFEQKDARAISQFFYYPFELPPPVPAIYSAEEFVRRIDEVVDDTVRERFISADIDKDLALMGWRGIMVKNGFSWIHEDSFKIFRIHYQTEVLQEKREALIREMKDRIHPDVREFRFPVLEYETHAYRFRIDEMEDGLFRYSAWPRAKTFADPPDIVVGGGEVEFPGSSSNHTYRFTNQSYVYEVNVHVVGHRTSPPADLIVKRDGKILLEQPIPKVWLSESYRVWIEYLRDQSVRLHLWKLDQKTTEDPEILLSGGEIEYLDDSFGNQYRFKHEGNVYEITHRFQQASDEIFPTLRITESGVMVLEQRLERKE